MDRSDHSAQKVNAVLHDIVLKKLDSKTRLSRDELWFYLINILRVSQDEAERIMEKLRLNQHSEIPGHPGNP